MLWKLSTFGSVKKAAGQTIELDHRKIQIFQDAMLTWYLEAGRHHLPWRKEQLTPYEIVIAEILLQRTKAETVQQLYPGFLTAFPNWLSIKSAGISLVEQQLKQFGLYRQRAKRLKDLALAMIDLGGNLPHERSHLESLPFFGQYLANSIELQVFGRPKPLLDVNMARVLERFFGPRKLADIRYDPFLQALAHQVVDHPRSKDVSWAILDFAASICKANSPQCPQCGLKQYCSYYKTLNIM